MRPVRVLANDVNVHQLFERCTMPYAFTGDDGKLATCEMPAWRCRRCGWQSLYGVRGLPFGHECRPTPIDVTTGVAQGIIKV